MDFEELSRFELKRGSHERPGDGLCLLEAVAWLTGEPHSDHPACVCPSIAHYCRSLNDRLEVRRQDLVPYIPRLVNTLDSDTVFRSRLRCLSREYLAIGGSRRLVQRLDMRFAKGAPPAYISSFGLAVLCDAVALKRPVDHAFALLDRLLSIASAPAPSAIGAAGTGASARPRIFVCAATARRGGPEGGVIHR